VSDEQENSREEAVEAAVPDPPKLRRRPFGYRKADVQQVLQSRDAELGEREAELVELRQDVAALWLAFAQHDRMIRSALGDDAGAAAPRTRPPEPAPSTTPEPDVGAPPAPAAAAAIEDAAIGRQLSDLDEVLAAIELATQTLERTYVEEIAEKQETAQPAAEAPSAESSEGKS
jgi:hypothetical protein